MKKKKGFSMVELLISLIAVSVIATAFAPVISKKVKASKKTITQGASITKSCESKVNANCKLCYKDPSNNYKCIKCDLSPRSGKYIDVATCTEKDCGIDNCINCTSTSSGIKCTKCSNAYRIKSNSTCELCPSGTYSINGVSCTTCPAGKYSTGGVSSCAPCDQGKYSEAGAGSCTTCPAGYECKNGIKTICAEGKYSTGGTSSCTSCPQGSFCTSGIKQTCPEGYYTDSTGKSSCSRCPAGYKCTNGIKSSAKVNCNSGFYRAEGNLCIPCPAGYTCTGGTLGGTGAATASSCRAGTYLQNGTCVGCPAGSSCNNGVITPCTAGYYSSANSSSCSKCDNGYYSSGNASSCSPCIAGYKCVNGIISKCTSGKYSNSGASSCLDCPDGYNCDNGTPIHCDTGCNKCSSNGNCSECKDGFLKDGNKCYKRPSSQADCDKADINSVFVRTSGNYGLCVTKRNAGDRGGPAIPADVIVRYLGVDRGIQYDHSTSTVSNVCWLLSTPEAESGVAGVAYVGGDERAVCTYDAAARICANHRAGGHPWRLGTTTEMNYFKSYTSQLSLCGAPGSGAPVNCDSNYRCTGASYYECTPYIVYAASNRGCAYTRNVGGWSCNHGLNTGFGASVRCVLDKIRE